MIESLSKDFIKEIYEKMTNRNENIKYYISSYRTNNPEEATNSPVKFGFRILFANFVYILPFVKSKKKSIQKIDLFKSFHRPPVQNFVSEIMDYQNVVFDGNDCFLLPIPKEEFYRILENKFAVKGFAKQRGDKQNYKRSLKDVYDDINEKLNCKIDYKIELELFKKLCFENDYLVRAAEILRYNNLNCICALESSYSKEFLAPIFEKSKFNFVKLITTNENNCSKKELLGLIHSNFKNAVISSDFKSFIKPAKKSGYGAFWYQSSEFLLKKIKLDIKNDIYKSSYMNCISYGLLNNPYGENYIYQISFLYIAPLIYGLLNCYKNENANNTFFSTGFEDDYIPSLVENVLKLKRVYMRNSLGKDLSIEAFFKQGLCNYFGVFELLNDETYTENCMIVQNAVRDFCKLFKKYTENLDIDEVEVLNSGKMIYALGENKVEKLYKKRSF